MKDEERRKHRGLASGQFCFAVVRRQVDQGPQAGSGWCRRKV